ncbi:MAG: glutamate--cysteine ligase [Rhodoferax sp.]|nr:glutamate--cysteine ligase [Rhodoferax sp.]
MHQFFPAPGIDDRQRLLGIRRGIEKESLRVLPDGGPALTPHPAALGSALTHPHITTDFSESQVELITGVHPSVQGCLAELAEIQQVTMDALEGELLWAASMPCKLPSDDEIPLGHYGTSNEGRSKTVYRTGLGHRYGRRMQTISGIHYNWSFPGLSSDDYFALIRNFRRQAFLLLYLFGASPVVCSCFVAGRVHPLKALNPRTLFLPHATSLRMGRLGYQSDAQANLSVSYNNLSGYGQALQSAMAQSYPPYEAIGVLGADGSYQQLATSLLQIENEFYGTIRPKRVTYAGERPLHALRARGVEYIEVRLMDLNPFEALGIHAQTMRFLDVFLVHCLEQPSPNDTPLEIASVARNQHKVAERGREPGLLLERDAGEQELVAWGREIIDRLHPIAQRLDAAWGGDDHVLAVKAATHLLDNPDELPSARVLSAVMGRADQSFLEFVRDQSRAHKKNYLAAPLAQDTRQRYSAMAQKSVEEQRRREAADSLSFEAYLEHYISPNRLELS